MVKLIINIYSLHKCVHPFVMGQMAVLRINIQAYSKVTITLVINKMLLIYPK